MVNENVLKPDGSVNERDSADFMRWTPINDFRGEFDGKGHSISGLYYNVKSGMDLERTGVGLFGTVRGGTSDEPVVIQNVGVEASYFGGVYNVGALIGFVQSKVNSNYTNVLILNSYSTSTIRAYQYGGGLVGKFDSYVFGAFVNCYGVGVVEAADSEMPYREIGALIAGNPRDIAIVNTYYLGILWDATWVFFGMNSGMGLRHLEHSLKMVRWRMPCIKAKKALSGVKMWARTLCLTSVALSRILCRLVRAVWLVPVQVV